MQYTTVEDIARRLRGRLTIKDQPPIDSALTDVLGYGTVVAGNTVDNALITQLAEEKEAYIDLILSQIYVMPLQLTSSITTNILRDISESLTISALIQVHFEGTNTVLQASDVSQASMDLRRHGEYLLQAIAASHNIWIPSIPGVDQTTPQGQRQPLRLPGEKLLAMNSLPDTITRNYSVVNRITNIDSQPTYFGNDTCGPCNTNTDGQVFGIESTRRCN